MVVNDNAGWQVPRGVLGFIANSRASTGCSYKGQGFVSLRLAHL
jgi:hypothetical protein